MILLPIFSRHQFRSLLLWTVADFCNCDAIRQKTELMDEPAPRLSGVVRRYGRDACDPILPLLERSGPFSTAAEGRRPLQLFCVLENCSP